MRWMLPGVAGGIENLARAFMHELLALDATNQYLRPGAGAVPVRLRRPRARQRPDRLPGLGMGDRAGVWDDAPGSGCWRRFDSRTVNTPEVRELSRLAELGVEIGYSFPGYIHPQLWPLRNVLVMPDIQHEYLPEFFAPEALEERRRVYTDCDRVEPTTSARFRSSRDRP